MNWKKIGWMWVVVLLTVSSTALFVYGAECPLGQRSEDRQLICVGGDGDFANIRCSEDSEGDVVATVDGDTYVTRYCVSGEWERYSSPMSHDELNNDFLPDLPDGRSQYYFIDGFYALNPFDTHCESNGHDLLGYGYPNGCCGDDEVDDCGFRQPIGYFSGQALCMKEGDSFSWAISKSTLHKGTVKEFTCGGSLSSFASFASGSAWRKCGEGVWDAGSIGSEEIDGITYGYLCGDDDSWLRCFPDGTSASGPGGVLAGEKFEVADETWYCSDEGRFTTDLQEAGRIACLDEGGVYSDSTGHCCITGETYGGHSASQACINGELVDGGVLEDLREVVEADLPANSIVVHEGQFYGCGINDGAWDSNDDVQRLMPDKDKQLRRLCERPTDLGGDYYCTSSGWILETSDEFFYEANTPSDGSSQCCPTNTCYTGDDGLGDGGCVVNVETGIAEEGVMFDVERSVFYGSPDYACYANTDDPDNEKSEWVAVFERESPSGDIGYCQKSSDCFFGNFDEELMCIQSGSAFSPSGSERDPVFLQDNLYCDNGEYVSRIKMLSYSLLNVAERVDEDYVLFCDDAHTVLGNFLDEDRAFKDPLRELGVSSGRGDDFSSESFCVLRQRDGSGQHAYLGFATENNVISIEDAANTLRRLFGADVDCLGASLDQEASGFQRCDNDLAYNAELGLLVFGEGVGSSLPANPFASVSGDEDALRDLLDASLMNKPVGISSERADSFFLSSKGDLQVAGGKDSDERFFAVGYANFGDLCSFESILQDPDNERYNKLDTSCKNGIVKYYTSEARRGDGEDMVQLNQLWLDLTARFIRLR